MIEDIHLLTLKEGEKVFCGNPHINFKKGPFVITKVYRNCFKIWNGSYFLIETLGSIFLSKQVLINNSKLSNLNKLFSNYSATVCFSPDGKIGILKLF